MSVPPRRAARPATGEQCGQGRPRPRPSTGRPPPLQGRIRDVTGSHRGPPTGPSLDRWSLPAGNRVPRAASTHRRRRCRHDHLEPEGSKAPTGACRAAAPMSFADPSPAPVPCLVVNQPHGRRNLLGRTQGARALGLARADLNRLTPKAPSMSGDATFGNRASGGPARLSAAAT